MTQKELVSRAAEVLRNDGVRKPVSVPKQVFHISDDEGHSKDFVVKRVDKSVLYTAEDVLAILNALRYVVQEATKSGEDVMIRGLGTLTRRYHKPKTVKNVLDGKKILLKGHYVPFFVPGNDLKRCLQIYEQALADQETNQPLPIFHKDGV